MTTEQLRELDAWIAERVMGLKEVKQPKDIQKGCFCVVNRLGDHTILIHDQGNRLREFRPRTDRAAAMEVLERCLATPDAYVRRIELQQRAHTFCVSSWRDESIGVEATTLPLAICLFAKQLFQEEEA